MDGGIEDGDDIEEWEENEECEDAEGFDDRCEEWELVEVTNSALEFEELIGLKAD